MPNPRDRSGYTYVRGHVRKSGKAAKRGRRLTRAEEQSVMFWGGAILLLLGAYYLGGTPLVATLVAAVASAAALLVAKKHTRYTVLKRPALICLLLCLLVSPGFVVGRVTESIIAVASVALLVAGVYILVAYTKKRSRAKRLERRETAYKREDELLQDEEDHLIRQALEHVDSVYRSYTDEDAANRELTTTLKALYPERARDIEYLAGSSSGDVRIGDNVIIEGKLDLMHKPETDRLVGQVHHGCELPTRRMKVVVYGRLALESRERIETLKRQYPGRVSLTVLDRPKRTRAQRPNGGRIT